MSRGGIPKRAIPSGLLTAAGIAGDAWHYPFHGGPRKAILLVTVEGIDELCATLDVYGTGIQAAMYDARVQKGDPESPLWGVSGFYASVVQPGSVRPGDAIVVPD